MTRATYGTLTRAIGGDGKASVDIDAQGITLRKGKAEMRLTTEEAHGCLELLAALLPAGPKRDYAMLVRRHRVMLDLAAALSEQAATNMTHMLRMLASAEAIAMGQDAADPDPALDPVAAAALPSHNGTERTAAPEVIATSMEASASPQK